MQSAYKITQIKNGTIVNYCRRFSAQIFGIAVLHL